MNIKITPSTMCGEVILPSSKSCMHRAVICASLADGQSIITFNGNLSDDISATIEGMRSLGAEININKNKIIINGILQPNLCADIACGESGSTLRFLMPVAAAICKEVSFSGKGRLRIRPLTPYHDIFSEYIRGNDELPLTLRGGFKTTDFYIRGDISSQFITGLLLAMPLICGKPAINVTSTLQSKPYINITMDIMKKYGITVEQKSFKSFTASGKYKPFSYTAESDWSAAAFWLIADCIGNNVLCRGLSSKTAQGDSQVIDIIKACGGEVFETEDGISATAKKLDSICVNVSDIPDLVPILAVLGCFCHGEFCITGAERLKIKESDRLQSISDGLMKMGAKISVSDSGLKISGMQTLKGGCTVSAYNDHRIAMALAIAASKCEKPVIISGAECVSKSYTSFFDDYRQLGGIADELNMG